MRISAGRLNVAFSRRELGCRMSECASFRSLAAAASASEPRLAVETLRTSEGKAACWRLARGCSTNGLDMHRQHLRRPNHSTFHRSRQQRLATLPALLTEEFYAHKRRTLLIAAIWSGWCFHVSEMRARCKAPIFDF